MSDNDPTVGSMAQSIAADLLSPSSSTSYGALILGQCVPANAQPPLYFDPGYALVARIVNMSVPPNDVQTISNALGAVQIWLYDTYAGLREDPRSTMEILHASVLPIQEQTLTDVIRPLMSDALAEPGFSVFLLAAATHLALVLELAYTDPLHPGGVGSPFVGTLKAYAQQYHDLIGVTWPKIVAARTKAISAATWKWGPPGAMGGPPVMAGAASWSDSIDGTSDSVPSDMINNPFGFTPQTALAQATSDRSAHVAAVLQSLATTLGDPVTIATNFLQLVASPLTSSARILVLSGSRSESVNYDNGYQQKVWSYSLSWSTSGGTASFDGLGNVPASGSRTFTQANTPPTVPSMMTVVATYGPAVTQAINWE